MTRDWNDLADDELVARLATRTNTDMARQLVDQRDDPHTAIVIDDLVGE